MMNRLLYFSIFIVLGCTYSKDVTKQIKDEVDQLATLEDRESYLTKIFEDDQSVRQSNSELIKLNQHISFNIETFRNLR